MEWQQLYRQHAFAALQVQVLQVLLEQEQLGLELQEQEPQRQLVEEVVLLLLLEQLVQLVQELHLRYDAKRWSTPDEFITTNRQYSLQIPNHFNTTATHQSNQDIITNK